MTVIKPSNKRFELRDISNALTDAEGDITGIDARVTALEGATMGVIRANGSATSDIADTTADVTWATPTITHSSVSISSNVITINTDGVYLFDVAVRTDSDDQSEVILHTHIDTGSGYSEDTSEISSAITGISSGEDTGTVHLNTVLELDDGDKVKFIAEGQVDGDCVLMTAGTRLRIVKL